MKKNKISKSWLIKQRKDPFFRHSKIQGYRSRSSFKLIEMNKKFKFLKKNFSVLDLGSSPGGWSQVVSREVTKGKILAVDKNPMEKINNVDFIVGNFTDTNISDKIILYFNNRVNVVLSDMATNTSGNKTFDTYQTGQLCLDAMSLATKILTKEGVFLSKMFMGSIYNEINEKTKKCFKKVVKYKPLSSKKESKEIYIFCKGILKI